MEKHQPWGSWRNAFFLHLPHGPFVRTKRWVNRNRKTTNLACRRSRWKTLSTLSFSSVFPGAKPKHHKKAKKERERGRSKATIFHSSAPSNTVLAQKYASENGRILPDHKRDTTNEKKGQKLWPPSSIVVLLHRACRDVEDPKSDRSDRFSKANLICHRCGSRRRNQGYKRARITVLHCPSRQPQHRTHETYLYSVTLFRIFNSNKSIQNV